MSVPPGAAGRCRLLLLVALLGSGGLAADAGPAPATLDVAVQGLEQTFAARLLPEHLAYFDPGNAELRARRERELRRIFATPIHDVHFRVRDVRAIGEGGPGRGAAGRTGGGIEATLVMAWGARTVIGEEPEGDVRRAVWRQHEGRWVIAEMDREWRGGFEVVHHDARVVVEPEKHRLSVRDKVALRFETGPPAPVYLYLLPELEVTNVTCADHEVPFTRVGGIVALELPKPQRDVRVVFHYSGIVPTGRYAIIRVEPDSAFALRTWYWLPAVPRARSEARVALDVPEKWLAVSAGRGTPQPAGAGRASMLWETGLSSPFLSFCAAPYVRASDGGTDPECSAYVFPEHTAAGAGWAESARKMLRFYATRFGPYRFPKFSIVEIRELPGAHASQSGIELPQAYFAATPSPTQAASVAHELAHQWFPYVAGAKPRDYMFLAEGLAEYASWLYLEESGQPNPREGEDSFLELVRGARDLPLLDCPLDGAYYYKAAMVHHMLRRVLDDDRFSELLHAFCNGWAGRSADAEEYRAAAEKIHGHRLDWFFRQWVTGRGVPMLSVGDAGVRRDGKRWRVSGKLWQGGDPFRLPVLIRVEWQGGHEDRVVWAEKAETRFSVDADGAPLRLAADPDRDLIRLPQGEIAVALDGVKGAGAE